MNTILVTGGAGFIGSNLVEALLRRGDRVVCVDNFSDNYNPKFKEANITPYANNPGFVLERADIRDLAAMQEIFRRHTPHAVVHLAAKADTRASIQAPQEYVDVNITGTLNVLECARTTDVHKFVFASSSSVYGNHATAPFAEDTSTDYAIAPYGATKKAGEVLAYTYHANFGLPVAVLRIFNAYGERNRPDLVLYKWVENILHGTPIEMSGKGVRMRDFTYVGDLVEAIIAAMDTQTGYEIFNIGNAHPIALADLLGVVERAVGTKATVLERPSNKGSVEMTHASVDKARRLLGWEPHTPIEEGVARLVAWFRNERLA